MWDELERVNKRVRRGRRMLFTILLFLLFSLASSSAMADDFPLGYPGSTWGKIIQDNDDIGGNGVQYNIVQGVDWYRFPGDIVLNSYAAWNHRSRENNPLYYNSEGPSGGVELVKGPVSVGYEYFKERLPKLQRTSHNRAYYFKGYFDWDYVRHSDGLRFPGSLWFQASRDASGINGSGLQFSFSQGINIWEFSNGAELNSYVGYRHRSRDKNQKYYDASGPYIGAEVKYSSFSAGVDYVWENQPHLNKYSARFQLYLSWYMTWDLKNSVRSKSKPVKVIAEQVVDEGDVAATEAVVEPASNKLTAKEVSKSETPVVAGIVYSQQEKEIKNALEVWLSAWNMEEINSFTNSYSSDFTDSHGQGKQAYINKKRDLFKRIGIPIVSISELSISSNGKRGSSTFMQDYKLAVYEGDKWVKMSDRGWKKLYWVNESGVWKISYEVWNMDKSVVDAKRPVFKKSKKSSLQPKPRKKITVKKRVVLAKPVIIPNSKDEGRVKRLVDNWLVSWNLKKVDTYAGFYSSDFLSASGLDKTQFISQQKSGFSKSTSPDVTISKVSVVISGEKADVIFYQTGKGSSSESGWKRLVWGKYGNEWRILYERLSSKKLTPAF